MRSLTFTPRFVGGSFSRTLARTGPYTNGDLIHDHGRAPPRSRSDAGGGSRGSVPSLASAIPPKARCRVSWHSVRASRSIARLAVQPQRSLTRSLAVGKRGSPSSRSPATGPLDPGTLVCTKGAVIRCLRVRIFLVVWRNSRATRGVDVMARKAPSRLLPPSQEPESRIVG